MKVKLKTWEQLKAEGFKTAYSYREAYIGRGTSPEVTFPKHWINNILGREGVIKEVVCAEEGRFLVQIGKYDYKIKFFMIDGDIDLEKIVEPAKKRFSWSRDPAKASAFGYNFPCDFRDITIDQAEELAKWVIQTNKRLRKIAAKK